MLTVSWWILFLVWQSRYHHHIPPTSASIMRSNITPRLWTHRKLTLEKLLKYLSRQMHNFAIYTVNQGNLVHRSLDNFAHFVNAPSAHLGCYSLGLYHWTPTFPFYITCDRWCKQVHQPDSYCLMDVFYHVCKWVKGAFSQRWVINFLPGSLNLFY